MTVRELMERMDSREFAYWQAELRIRYEEDAARMAQARAEASVKDMRARKR